MKKFLLIILTLGIPVIVSAQPQHTIVSAPAGSRYTGYQPEGEMVIPNGRIITPYGKCFPVAPHPYGLALSNDGTLAITANSGISPLSISILRNIHTEQPEIQQIPPTACDEGVLESVFMGLALSPDNTTAYVAGGQANKVYLFNMSNGEAKGSISCSQKTDLQVADHGYIGDLVITKDGRFL